MKKENIFLVTSLIAIVTIIIFFIAVKFNWFGIPNGIGGEFCEAANGSFFLQPTNTISNLGFVLSGLYCARILSKNNSNFNNAFLNSKFIGVFFCISTILLGPCSAAMHATETSLGGLFDMNSMYLFAGFMFAYALKRYLKLSSLLFATIYFLVLIICNIAGSYKSFFGLDFYAGSATFGVFCVLGILIEFLYFKTFKVNIRFKFAVLCSLSFIIAFIVWHFGKDGHCFCNPDSLFQWHGVWHILCGLSTYFIFKYYTSENIIQTQ